MVTPKNELLFVPLGGSGEIGMNLNLYGHDGRWLMLDCGVGFTRTARSTRVVMPDPAFIEQRRDALDGIVITHAHMDHIGAVVDLWPRLRCPVYATPFSAAVLRPRLENAGLLGDVELVEVPTGGQQTVGPFELTFVGVTHSTVESNAVVVTTPLGSVLHTGDFKFDPNPCLGGVTEAERLRAWGEKGLLAVVGDSTNALSEGHSTSEGSLRAELPQVFDRFRGRIATGCFSSNLARIQTLVNIARSLDRHPVILGRSIRSMVSAARATGYLDTFEAEVDSRDFGYLPPSKTFLICTGTQAEPRAALSRIAVGEHPDVILERGDAVVFSSKIIPGNEAPIEDLHHRLRRLGTEVVSEREAFVHVSGHPKRDELRELYDWTRPAVAVPVHGEEAHMRAHAELAREAGVPRAVVPFNGAVVRLAPGRPRIVGQVRAGRLVAR